MVQLSKIPVDKSCHYRLKLAVAVLLHSQYLDPHQVDEGQSLTVYFCVLLCCLFFSLL